MPKWRNWYTRTTQNRVPSRIVGSSPTFGTIVNTKSSCPQTAKAACSHSDFGLLFQICSSESKHCNQKISFDHLILDSNFSTKFGILSLFDQQTLLFKRHTLILATPSPNSAKQNRRDLPSKSWRCSFHGDDAQVVELVDTPALGAGPACGIEVRVLSWAPSRKSAGLGQNSEPLFGFPFECFPF